VSVLPAESDPEDGYQSDDPEERAAGHPTDGLRPVPQLDHSIAPRKPRTIGGAVFLVVLTATLVGVLIVMVSRVQVGLSTIGGALVAGAVARLLLPPEQAGMLGVRRKLIDVSTMAVVGGALLVIAALIRERPL